MTKYVYKKRKKNLKTFFFINIKNDQNTKNKKYNADKIRLKNLKMFSMSLSLLLLF
jgi:hypothetical protein